MIHQDDRCASCMSPNAVPMLLSCGVESCLCPKCTAEAALSEAAESNLHALLWPIVCQWIQHWHAAGCSVGQLSAALWVYGTYWHHHGEYARPSDQADPIQQAITQALNSPIAKEA